MITYFSDTTEPYDYGTTATYQCDSGYELTGGDTVKTCTGDGSSPMGQWDGSAPHCTGKGHTHGLYKLLPSLSLEYAAIFQSINIHLVLVIL